MKPQMTSLNAPGLYQGVLKDHSRRPCNYGDLHDAAVIRRGSNPLCGDDVELGLYYQDTILRQVRFRGRGCMICIASASLMTEAVAGKSRDAAHQIVEEIKFWLNSKNSDSAPVSLESLHALLAVRNYPARRQCALLAWQVLDDALNLA